MCQTRSHLSALCLGCPSLSYPACLIPTPSSDFAHLTFSVRLLLTTLFKMHHLLACTLILLSLLCLLFYVTSHHTAYDLIYLCACELFQSKNLCFVFFVY